MFRIFLNLINFSELNEKQQAALKKALRDRREEIDEAIKNVNRELARKTPRKRSAKRKKRL